MNVASALDDIAPYDPGRYEGWSIAEITASLRGATLTLLKRGSLATLVARREWGGMLVAASKLVTNVAEQVTLFRNILDLDYSEARRHMKVWVFWPRIEKMLSDRETACERRRLPFIVPGYRRCLSLAGLTRTSPPATTQPPPPVEAEPLPTDMDALIALVENLQLQNRLEREKQVSISVELDLAKEQIQELLFDHDRAPESTDPKPRWLNTLANLFGSKRRRPMAATKSERPSDISLRIGNCLDLIEQDDNIYDAIVTDPPYSISLHGYGWDRTGITFAPELWQRLFRAIKPGGYAAVFAAPRLYHRVATACEAAGFTIHPYMAWRFKDGLPKPVNLAELFDRDNISEREIIGYQRGSGFTKANVHHGAQHRSHMNFAVHERHVSSEAQQWRGYYYGVNALQPCMEPVLLAQKPISETRVIDNVRRWGTGALNVGALRDSYGHWPNTLFTHRKAERSDHESDHPSVKPVPLMEDLCTLVCPGGGRILDPFAGTGTTGVAARNRGFDCVLIEQNALMGPVIERRLHPMSAILGDLAAN